MSQTKLTPLILKGIAKCHKIFNVNAGLAMVDNNMARFFIRHHNFDTSDNVMGLWTETDTPDRVLRFNKKATIELTKFLIDICVERGYVKAIENHLEKGIVKQVVEKL
jgi:hypothetical protein